MDQHPVDQDPAAPTHAAAEPEPPAAVEPLTDQQIAAICHEANRAYCAYRVGDFSQEPWYDAPHWQVESAVLGVSKIRSGEIRTPRDAHQSWCDQKIADGWAYGDVKDPERKTHPCLVAYEELPADQRRKDFLFYSIVQALL